MTHHWHYEVRQPNGTWQRLASFATLIEAVQYLQAVGATGGEYRVSLRWGQS